MILYDRLGQRRRTLSCTHRCAHPRIRHSYGARGDGLRHRPAIAYWNHAARRGCQSHRHRAGPIFCRILLWLIPHSLAEGYEVHIKALRNG